MDKQLKKDRDTHKVKKQYMSPTLQRFGAIRDLTSGGSGTSQENSQVPPQAQPNNFP